MMQRHLSPRSIQRRTVLVMALVLAIPVSGQSMQAPAGGTSGADSKSDPKCLFLRQELARLEHAAVAVSERVPPGIRAAFIPLAQEARIHIAEGNIRSCEKKEKLSSLARLRTLDQVRSSHVDKIRKQFQGSSGDALVEALNRLYEDEARSYYDYEKLPVQTLDRDVVKDFPRLLELVQRSSLSEEMKAAFTKNFKFIGYAEAGRLQNGLLGVDKDLGTTFLYVLRNDLAERAAEDENNRKAAEVARLDAVKAAEEVQAQALERVKLNARMTLSLSALVVITLAGWILVGRELLNWHAVSQVLIVAGILLALWILIGMGLLTWLSGYIGLAF